MLFCVSCTLDGGKNVHVEDLKFETTDDSEIFFKNLRQSAYAREEVSQMIVFRHKNYREIDSTFFQVSLVWNWLNDKAYILVDTPAESEDTLSLMRKNTGERWMISESQTAVAQTTSTARIYNALVDQDTVYISNNSFRGILFGDPAEKEAFRITMSDFFRLTNNF